MATVKINARGQITVPLRYRELLGLKPGTSMAIVVNGDKLESWPIRGFFDHEGALCAADELSIEEKAKRLLEDADNAMGRKRRIPPLRVVAGHESA